MTTERIQQTESLLETYGKLRWQKYILEQQIKELEPQAIQQAFEVLCQGETINGKRKVYESHNDYPCSITLQFRTVKPKPSDDQDLESLAEAIALEQRKAEYHNADALQSIDAAIATLQAKRDQLSQTDAGRQLQAEYAAREAALTCKKPSFLVRLE
ncbi:hypothetical protein [Laspinema palackyanum]|uniref:hypothetical protein n=1 Tax=Laspinema palackyanum TaxID=3231601 RepID=UPI00345D6F09|nr:hypothetical protein [Laspinema sp. D2c]